MPFGRKLEDLLSQGRSKLEERLGGNHSSPSQQNSNYPGNTYPQQQQQPLQGNGNFAGGHPPPINYASKPGSKPNVYWRPSFNTNESVTQHFRHETGAHGWGNNELQNYTADNTNSFARPNGDLVIRAVANSQSQGDKYTSARLTSHQTLARDKGCLIVRLTPPCASGVWPAFWLLPQDPFSWPTDGEVDIFESWNGDRMNHSCLHWGHFNGEDWNKHRVIDSHVPDMDRAGGHTFSFVWDQPEHGDGGKMVWYLDERAVMKASIPPGTRRMKDFRIIANVAIGGNVCGGKVPADGSYELIVHELAFLDAPPRGWKTFEEDFKRAAEGHTS